MATEATKYRLARLRFDFGVANTTDEDCQQQVLGIAVRLQQLTTLAARLRPARLTQGDHSPENVKFPDGLRHSEC